jgi:hypothetical protein
VALSGLFLGLMTGPPTWNYLGGGILGVPEFTTARNPGYARVAIPSWSAPVFGPVNIPPNIAESGAKPFYTPLREEFATWQDWSRTGVDLTFPNPTGPWLDETLVFGLWDAASGGNLIWSVDPDVRQRDHAVAINSPPAPPPPPPTYAGPDVGSPVVIKALDVGNYPNNIVNFASYVTSWPWDYTTETGFGSQGFDIAAMRWPTFRCWQEPVLTGVLNIILGRGGFSGYTNTYFGFWDVLNGVPYTGSGLTPQPITWSAPVVGNASIDAGYNAAVGFIFNTNDLFWTITGGFLTDPPTGALTGAIYKSATPGVNDMLILLPMFSLPPVYGTDPPLGPEFNPKGAVGQVYQLPIGRVIVTIV